MGRFLTVVSPEGPFAEPREAQPGREQHPAPYGPWRIQIQCLLASIFLEFLQVMKKGVTSASARYRLKHHLTPQDIVAYGLPDLVKTLRKVNRGKLKADRAQALYDGAKSSVGMSRLSEHRDGDTGASFLYGSLGRDLLRVWAGDDNASCPGSLQQHTPFAQRDRRGHGSRSDRRSWRLPEVPHHERDYACGLDLFEVSSGRHKGQRHISQTRPVPLMRKLLYCRPQYRQARRCHAPVVSERL